MSPRRAIESEALVDPAFLGFPSGLSLDPLCCYHGASPSCRAALPDEFVDCFVARDADVTLDP